MKTLRRIIGAALFAAIAALAQPPGVYAEKSCSEDYMKCIAAAGLLQSPEQELADIQCGSNWAVCIASKLKFW